MTNKAQRLPSLYASSLPIIFLLVSFIAVILTKGADEVQTYSQAILLIASAIAGVIAVGIYRQPIRNLTRGLIRSASQVLPTIPILILIACVSATWMLSGIVPTLITLGVEYLDARFFLVSVCGVCAVISVLCGSSWTTIATIGVAFMGIGSVWGYDAGWIAGAVISGAYFGDKVSPLSDTTVLASSTCSVSLFPHIINLMRTTVPAMLIALLVFTLCGFFLPHTSSMQSSSMIHAIGEVFNVSPICLIVPAITFIMIIARCNTLLILSASAALGLVSIFLFQPQVVSLLCGEAEPNFMAIIMTSFRLLLTNTRIDMGDEIATSLIATGGIKGMLPTITLVLSAMVFGGVMMGTGMIDRLTQSITAKLRSRKGTVVSTVFTGIFLNGCTGDQYLAIILNGNLYKGVYERNGLEGKLLSRTVEDSTSVTSVLIPWNSCGLAQSAVLGIATLHYLPYCIFNIASPIIAIIYALLYDKVKALFDKRRMFGMPAMLDNEE